MTHSIKTKIFFSFFLFISLFFLYAVFAQPTSGNGTPPSIPTYPQPTDSNGNPIDIPKNIIITLPDPTNCDDCSQGSKCEGGNVLICPGDPCKDKEGNDIPGKFQWKVSSCPEGAVCVMGYKSAEEYGALCSNQLSCKNPHDSDGTYTACGQTTTGSEAPVNKERNHRARVGTPCGSGTHCEANSVAAGCVSDS